MGSPQLAYFKHWADIRSYMTIEDISRVDSLIAVRLRANGYSQEEVEATIRTCAPSTRERRAQRNWVRYAERTTAYAFGYAGDKDMDRNKQYQELWRRIEWTVSLGEKGLIEQQRSHI